ncbi:MAG: hypothetical protein R6W78_00245 [Bacteroidales bacterium]
MKRTIIVLLTLFTALNLKSQDTLKAGIGNISTELNVNLLQGELSFNNSINQIKLRFFDKSNKCYRFGFMFNVETHDESSEFIYNTTPRDYKNKSNIYEIALSFGREKHFSGTKRLSPYIGFDFTFTDSWTKNIIENQDSKTTYTNVTFKTETILTNQGYYTTTTRIGNNANYSFGLNLLTGFDFYISKNLYLGYEFNLGGKYIIYKKMEYEIDIKSTSGNSFPSITVPDENDANDFKFGPSLINGIRLGYIF